MLFDARITVLSHHDNDNDNNMLYLVSREKLFMALYNASQQWK